MCKEACTKYPKCIGYAYLRGIDFCYLIPSVNKCPDGYSLNRFTLAKSSTDLVERKKDGYVLKQNGTEKGKIECFYYV